MRRTLFALLAMGALVAIAWAQANNSNTWQTPGNQTVGGVVQMCLNGTSLAVPCNSGAAGAAGFPGGATPVTASNSGTTAAVTATIPAVAGKTAYLCGFVDDAVATAATAVVGTITGLSGGTFTYVQQVGTLTGTGNYHYQINYSPCLAASAVNTQIQLVSGAPGAGGVQGVMLWGFYL
jgi:hypothetical protein